MDRISPIRVLPFDIGTNIDAVTTEKIRTALHCEYLTNVNSLKQFSKGFLCGYKITESIELCVYDFGIGVFCLYDNPTEIIDETFYYSYCKERRRAHSDLLKHNHAFSNIINNTIDTIRKIVTPERITANKDWENGGISYVMTFANINCKSFNPNYNEMSSEEKRAINILMTPSLIGEEDSNIFSLSENRITNEPEIYSYSNLLRSSDMGAYISWAAVIGITKTESTVLKDFLYILEVDLQAMWMYLYCNYAHFQSDTSSTTLKELSEIKYIINQKYIEFCNEDDSSIPEYIRDIREEMVTTSHIKTRYEKLNDYLSHKIEQAKLESVEKQRRYAWIIETLLFIIAFIQIAPLLYNVIIGEIRPIKPIPIIIMSIFVIIGITLIRSKERM